MILGVTCYRGYQDSGVPWLREVPEHWEIRRLKNVCRLMYGDSLPAESRRPGEKSVLGSNGKVGSHEEANTLGPCIIVGRKGSFGKVNYSQESVFAIDTTYYIDNRHTNENLRWLFYILQQLGLDDISRDSAVPGLDRVDAYKKVIAVPLLSEQVSIAHFLDHASRQIRRYIGVKQKLINLLEEQKQVIIHQAVTHGLNSNVRLKSSGVEWLGNVPEHWEIKRNGQFFKQRNQTGYGELPILEVSLKTGVRVREFENAKRKQVMSDRDKYKRAKKGDIAYNMMRMWQGAVGVVPVDGLVSPAYVVAKPLQGVDARYFDYLFHTPAYMGEVDSCSRGIVKDRNRLYWEDFKQIYSPFPPFEEQSLIADVIKARTKKIDDATAAAQREISLLREYRTRLIADVVTGKLDVREAAAKLPDEIEQTDAFEGQETLPEMNENGVEEVSELEEADE